VKSIRQRRATRGVTAAFRLVVVIIIVISAAAIPGRAQSTNYEQKNAGKKATINWTDVHQAIDGFGAADAYVGPLSSAYQDFFFGLGEGQLGLSLLRTAVPNNADVSGDCTTVNSGCAGPYVSDMQAVLANGGRVYSSPWTPPAAYKTNGLTYCTDNSGLSTADYGLYATWLANYVESLQQEDSISLYALSVQNEPDICQTYDSAVWTSEEIDSFVAQNLGPTFALDKLTTLIFVPEPAGYYGIDLGSTCASDKSCTKYVGGINWHDYDASLSGTNTVVSDPYPSGWPKGKKYWETEASCAAGGVGPAFCQPGFNTDITDALDWAAVIDERIAVDGANAWLYWWLLDGNSGDDEGLVGSNGTVALRAYMLGQYSKFVRPGYHRISATHLPEPEVSVSAYKDTATDNLVIIATNYGESAVSQEFDITNAPSFSSLTPWITSATLSLAQQASVSVSSNSFTYTLPAQSITTFVANPAPAQAVITGFLVNGVSANNGPVNATLTIQGSGFGNNMGWSTATLNGGALAGAAFGVAPISWNNTSIVVTIPDDSTSGPVIVTVNSQPSNSLSFYIDALISQLLPTSALAGSEITINGQGFGISGIVTFNGVQSPSIPLWTASSIQAVVPTTATEGPVVVTATGSQPSNGVTFTPTPAISGLSPSSGGSGTQVIISGNSFGVSQAAGNSAVTFNGVPASVSSWSNTSTTATAPSNGSTGPVAVTVNGVPSAGIVFTYTPR
jgi:glucuronoarabinoxylan endo-1,4-beta-xylanase